MFKVLGSMLSYDFMIRAIIVGSLVSLCSTLLGTSLVLKRYSMIGDGLSHVGFAALAIAYALQLAPMSVSIPICVIAAFFPFATGRKFQNQGRCGYASTL